MTRQLTFGELSSVASSAQGPWAGSNWLRSALVQPLRAVLLNLALAACGGSQPGSADASGAVTSQSPPAHTSEAATASSRASWPDLSSAIAAAGDGTPDAAVIVAIEEYAFLPSIPGAVANGRDWFSYLTRSRKVPVEHVTFLTNNEATDFAILRAAAAASSNAQAGGKVWFIFIGHGAPSSATADGLLVAADAQQTVEGLENRSVAESKVLSVLSKSAATPIALFDACFSGRRYDGQTLIAGLQPTRVVQTAVPSGALVMTAAASNQYAGPLPGEQRPAFSYLALGAMRGWGDSNLDGSVTAQEVVDYAKGVLMTFLSGDRSQTPEVVGLRSFRMSLASEAGPDLGHLLLELKSRSHLSASGRANALPSEPESLRSVTQASSSSPFNHEAAKRALHDAATQASQCRPAQGPRGSGRVRVSYEPTGRVAEVSLLTPRFEKTLTGSCVRLVFRRAGVPPFAGATPVTVVKSFEIPED